MKNDAAHRDFAFSSVLVKVESVVLNYPVISSLFIIFLLNLSVLHVFGYKQVKFHESNRRRDICQDDPELLVAHLFCLILGWAGNKIFSIGKDSNKKLISFLYRCVIPFILGTLLNWYIYNYLKKGIDVEYIFFNSLYNIKKYIKNEYENEIINFQCNMLAEIESLIKYLEETKKLDYDRVFDTEKRYEKLVDDFKKKLAKKNLVFLKK